MDRLNYFFWTFILSTGLVSGSWPVLAQPTLQNEMQMIRTTWHQNKRDLVKDFMKFTPSEESNFWPVYNAYSDERRKLADQRLMILADYTLNYKGLTDDKAESLTNQILNNDLLTLKLERRYYKIMKKALSAHRASQFLLLEGYLQTTLRAQVQESVPFLGELGKSKIP
jgi:hypothetical protein